MLGLPYIHQFPGLVHFVFVDRTRNRVYAPAITALHGQGAPLSPAQSAAMRDVLHKRVRFGCWCEDPRLCLARVRGSHIGCACMYLCVCM